tara:strand:+ start:373 stop:1842 length:1470 start_codon:yes stop_codon:yes gene_type:complete
VRESKRQKKKQIQNHKLGVIVPYRDRPQQLKRFVKHMENYLKDIDYEIFVIEQSDNKSFNRGKLLNVGYKLACDKSCDYFVFHDIDMLPQDVDYSYSEKPLHLATHLQEHDYETTFFDYFGGVTMFTKEDFNTINGFSNEYWGWGFEDDDLLIRCIEGDLDIDKENSNPSDIKEVEAFMFTGDNSYVKLESKNTTLLQDEFTISAIVKPTDIKISENKNYDEYPIISIPGHNIGLFYNSFRTFFCQVYDENKKSYSIPSDILGERWVHLTMKYEVPSMITESNLWKVSFYIDGELIDIVEMDSQILQLSSDKIIIGAGSDSKENIDFFNGLIGNVEMYDVALTDSEIKEISNNPFKVKLRNFGEYKSSNFLYTQILSELSSEDSCIDLSQTYSVSLNNIYLYKGNHSINTFLPKPHRRESRFLSMKHKTNSSLGNRWVHKQTRKNQIKYYNEVRQDIIDFRIDGLNTLRFNKISDKSLSKKTNKISVEL